MPVDRMSFAFPFSPGRYRSIPSGALRLDVQFSRCWSVVLAFRLPAVRSLSRPARPLCHGGHRCQRWRPGEARYYLDTGGSINLTQPPISPLPRRPKTAPKHSRQPFSCFPPYRGERLHCLSPWMTPRSTRQPPFLSLFLQNRTEREKT